MITTIHLKPDKATGHNQLCVLKETISKELDNE